MFPRKRPAIDMMLLQRHQMFIRHPDRRLLIVSVKKGRTFVNEWLADGEGDVIGIGRINQSIGFDGYGWDLKTLIEALDKYIGRVCGFCGTRIAHNRLYCSDKCRMASYRARKG